MLGIGKRINTELFIGYPIPEEIASLIDGTDCLSRDEKHDLKLWWGNLPERRQVSIMQILENAQLRLEEIRNRYISDIMEFDRKLKDDLEAARKS